MFSLPFSLFSQSVYHFGFQSVIEDVFKRLQSLFRRREVMAIAETTTGEQIAISTPAEPSVMPMQLSESISAEVGIEEDEVGVPKEIDNDSSFEVLEITEGMRHIRFSDGTEAYVGMDLSDDDVLHQKAWMLTPCRRKSDLMTRTVLPVLKRIENTMKMLVSSHRYPFRMFTRILMELL